MKKRKRKPLEPALRIRRRRLVMALRVHDREVVLRPDGTRDVKDLRKDEAEKKLFAQKLIALDDLRILYGDAIAPSKHGKRGVIIKAKYRATKNPVQERIREAVHKMRDRDEDMKPHHMDLELMPKYGPKSRHKISEAELKKLIRATVKAWGKKKSLL